MADDEEYATWLKVLATLDEVRARWYVAQKAIELGHGGLQKVHALTGISRPTITKGMRELRDPKGLRISERLRRAGGGRKRLEVLDPALRRGLDRIMDENTRGDPMSLLRWSSKSTERIAAEMTQLGHPMSADTVRRVLHQLEYSLHANVQVKEGERHPDRDDQSRSINAQVNACISPGPGAFGGYQEAGAGRRVQKPWANVAQTGTTARGAGR
jgi:hypothetical protein